jgi:hypothetical protein
VSDRCENAVVLKQLAFDMATVHCVVMMAIFVCIWQCKIISMKMSIAQYCELYNMTKDVSMFYVGLYSSQIYIQSCTKLLFCLACSSYIFHNFNSYTHSTVVFWDVIPLQWRQYVLHHW